MKLVMDEPCAYTNLNYKTCSKILSTTPETCAQCYPKLVLDAVIFKERLRGCCRGVTVAYFDVHSRRPVRGEGGGGVISSPLFQLTRRARNRILAASTLFIFSLFYSLNSIPSISSFLCILSCDPLHPKRWNQFPVGTAVDRLRTEMFPRGQPISLTIQSSTLNIALDRPLPIDE